MDGKAHDAASYMTENDGMATAHNLGFPRIGAKRELKFALESFWKGLSTTKQLTDLGAELRQRHWQHQSALDSVAVGDFSFYDQVLDMSFMLGNVPARVRASEGDPLDAYFRVARGSSAGDSACSAVHAGEMTKWLDTNFHYIVPEFSASTEFGLEYVNGKPPLNHRSAVKHYFPKC